MHRPTCQHFMLTCFSFSWSSTIYLSFLFFFVLKSILLNLSSISIRWCILNLNHISNNHYVTYAPRTTLGYNTNTVRNFADPLGMVKVICVNANGSSLKVESSHNHRFNQHISCVFTNRQHLRFWSCPVPCFVFLLLMVTKVNFMFWIKYLRIYCCWDY